MDETRVQALRYACIAMRGAPFTEITKAAESFETFLRGNGEQPSATAATQETVGQPSATDFGKADQTPSFALLGDCKTDDEPSVGPLNPLGASPAPGPIGSGGVDAFPYTRGL